MVDRLVLAPGLEQRLAESIETALGHADGLVVVDNADTGEQLLLSAKFACPVSGFTIEEIEPRLFSFNNPYGACPTCDGLGRRLYMDPDLVVPDPEKSLYDGAIEPWANSTSTYYLQALDGIAKHFRASLHTPWQELPEAMQALILHGSGDEKVELSFDDGLRRYSTQRPFEGVLPNLQRRWRETESAWLKEELGQAISAARRARPAAATASSPRRSRSRSTAATSARSPTSRSTRPRPGFGTCPRIFPPSTRRSRGASSRRSTTGSASCAMSASAT